MNMEQATLLASLVTPALVAAGALAAFFQLKQLRRANELQGYLPLIDALNSERMIEARRYCAYDVPVEFAAHPERFASGSWDPRIIMVGNFFTEVGALVYQGGLARCYVLTFLPPAAQAWKALSPLIESHRASNPAWRTLWAPLEYLAYLERTGTYTRQQFQNYPPELRKKFLDPED